MGVNGEFGRRPHNPAFEVIYVYSQKEGSLDLNFRGSYKGIEPLQEMFATAILKLPELPSDPKDERVYDLNPLRQKGFDFVYDAGSGIQDVAVKKLRLSSKVEKGDRITLEADAIHNPDAVYEWASPYRCTCTTSRRWSLRLRLWWIPTSRRKPSRSALRIPTPVRSSTTSWT
jgi:hypothetical protein